MGVPGCFPPGLEGPPQLPEHWPSVGAHTALLQEVSPDTGCLPGPVGCRGVRPGSGQDGTGPGPEDGSPWGGSGPRGHRSDLLQSSPLRPSKANAVCLSTWHAQGRAWWRPITSPPPPPLRAAAPPPPRTPGGPSSRIWDRKRPEAGHGGRRAGKEPPWFKKTPQDSRALFPAARRLWEPLPSLSTVY